MVHILGEMHKYVPTKSYKEDFTTFDGEVIQIPKAVIHPVLFGGNQLTAARAKSAKVNSIDPCLRLEGLLPFAEDWHTKLNFLGVCSFKYTPHTFPGTSITSYYKNLFEPS